MHKSSEKQLWYTFYIISYLFLWYCRQKAWRTVIEKIYCAQDFAPAMPITSINRTHTSLQYYNLLFLGNIIVVVLHASLHVNQSKIKFTSS